MTTTLIAASGKPSAGDTTEPLSWEAPAFPDYPTHLELGTVANPALREVLAHFASEREPELWLSETTPGVVCLRREVSQSVDQRIRLFISGSTSDPHQLAPVLRWLASTTGQLLQSDEEALAVLGRGASPGEHELGQVSEETAAKSDVPSRETGVVDVVQWLAQQLGVPDGDILQAAKIKRRNWHNWKNGSSPRLETQGQLWALLNSVRSLGELFDGSPAGWFQEGGPERRALLTSGRHRKLVQEALLEASLRGEFTDESSRRRRKKSAAGFYG
ncbi:hypothetical protein [Nocardioides acrostichi]|uniref:Uncharacterized protein n=1 Tax=Nocardioides acrostichi TaxID=2784339 RepID=A0A930V4S4_9ACTN|nr:hypothetical protein [Nocardioides acrostichi]MBF4163979.1 hypothetical protein [Nocardioides acrostichi]